MSARDYVQPSGPIRATPWFAEALPPAERAAVVAAMPAGHWIVGSASGCSASRKLRTYQAVLAGPDGEVARASSGLPFVACLRVLGIEP